MNEISINDKEFFSQLFRLNKREHNEFNFSTIFCWNEVSQYRWFEVDDWVILCSLTYNALLMPLCKTGVNTLSPEQFTRIIKRAQELGFSGKTLLIEKSWHLLHDEQLCPGIILEDDRGNYDYIYRTTDLSHLAGRNYSKKRNLISQFEKQYPKWRAVRMEKGDEDLCFELAERWCKKKDCTDPSIVNEMKALAACLNNREILGVEGTIVYLCTTPIAFALWGKQHQDMATVHFEKADYEFKGIGQIINRETARHIEIEGLTWINREQDLGEEGLRQAKQSYYPDHMIEVSKMVLV